MRVCDVQQLFAHRIITVNVHLAYKKKRGLRNCNVTVDNGAMNASGEGMDNFRLMEINHVLRVLAWLIILLCPCHIGLYRLI